jgi:hypothetical protein
MRLGVAWIPCSNANYRALFPVVAMKRRGHQIVLPADNGGEANFGRLAGCDVVHVYRRADDQTRRVLRELAGHGVAVTFDNDDDLAALPRESPNYKQFGGAIGRQLFAQSVNHLAADAPRPRRRHDGIVIGWVAGIEHQADLVRMPLEHALQRLIDHYSEVQVESIGVKLRLSERYRHKPMVEFNALPERIGGFDLGIAPLADIRANRSRSDIKLKEYGASGVPWLASPVGPYVGLGEAQGGRLVSDDGWYDALEALVTDPGARARLGSNAEAWAQEHTMDAAADRWEQIFSGAALSARNVAPSPPTSVSRQRPPLGVPARAARPR